jgi:hypothetical protein
LTAAVVAGYKRVVPSSFFPQEIHPMYAPRRTCLLALAIVAAAVSGTVAADVRSDFLAITDQKKVVLQQGFIGEAAETKAADQNKVTGLNFKIDVPTDNFMNGDFPTSGVHFTEPVTGNLSDTIELMVVSTTPQTITFQLQIFSDGEKSNGDVVPVPPLANAVPVREEGRVQDLTPLLFPMFYFPNGKEKGKGPSPFRVYAASDVEGVGLLVPEPTSVALLAVAGLLGLGHVCRVARYRSTR